MYMRVYSFHRTKKSMAFNVVFTPKDEELKAKAVEKYVKNILTHLKDTVGVTLRG